MKKSMKKKGQRGFIFASAVLLAISAFIILAYANSGFKEIPIELDDDYNELFSEEEVHQHLGDKPLSSYLTDATVAYKNIDGSTSLYVYSSPINIMRGDQYEMIDTRIINVRDDALRQQGFVYTVVNNNVVPYYPKELSESSGIRLSKDFYYNFGPDLFDASYAECLDKNNFLDEKKKMVTYENSGIEMSFYPSAIGTNCEIKFVKKPESNKMSFWLEIPDTGLSVSKEQGGYLVIHKAGTEATIDGAPEKSIVAVIQPPLLKDSNNEVYYNNSVDVNKISDGRYKVEFALDDNGLSKNSVAYVSWEMRVEKQPDTVLYSGKPKLQYAYLLNRSIIGNSTDYGVGRSLIRYRFCNPFNLNSSDIQKATYYLYDISRLNKNHPKQNFQLSSVLEDWCSLLVNWNSKLEIGNQTSHFNESGAVLDFNITNEVKKWCDDPDGLAERMGVVLKSSDETMQTRDVVLSNDNALFRNRTEIILK